MNRTLSRSRSIVALTLALLLGTTLILAGCSPAEDEEIELGSDVSEPTDSDASGTRLAPGLYDLADKTVQAVGTLEYRDLEGGFWAVIGIPGAEGDVVAVLANIQADNPAYTALEGKTVVVTGTRLEGASIRMAGPEIEATAIEEITDTGGPAS